MKAILIGSLMFLCGCAGLVEALKTDTGQATIQTGMGILDAIAPWVPAPFNYLLLGGATIASSWLGVEGGRKAVGKIKNSPKGKFLE